MPETTIQAVPSNSPVVHSPSISGAQNMRMSRAGQLMTADWRYELLLAGYCYRYTIGGATAGAAELPVAGGGAGTTIDQDQPEFAIGAPSGYTLIPLRFDIALNADLDATDEVANILALVDLAAGIQVDGTMPTVSPVNMLSGATDYPGIVRALATADITDPTVSQNLFWRNWRGNDAGTAASQHVTQAAHLYEPQLPPHFAGPCAIYGYWGGSASTLGMATLEWAIVPTSAYPRFTRA